MTKHPPGPDQKIWKKKAAAFATRSHRHLWGKNNEDPLAFLFTRGLKNKVIKDLYLGWNKFGQERPMKNWGFQPGPGRPEKFLLPAGIVVPLILNQNLISVFIYQYTGPPGNRTVRVPGSSSPDLILGAPSHTLVILKDLMDGLYIFQETGHACRVLVHPDPAVPPDMGRVSNPKPPSKVLFLSGKKESPPETARFFPGIKPPDLFFYESTAAAVRLILSQGKR